jgi:hypothetical protein
LEGFKVKGEFGEEERRSTNTGIKKINSTLLR